MPACAKTEISVVGKRNRISAVLRKVFEKQRIGAGQIIAFHCGDGLLQQRPVCLDNHNDFG
jgi:hypothetical protein